jgi:anthranilate synthase/aminodeoxychorismate synthase-like glutamine amidotransferase
LKKILLIDNYDSFTYNLAQAFLSLEAEVVVFRNDEIDLSEAALIKPTHLVISPGPGRPENAGISLSVIETFQKKIPILGVCLGHQCIVEAFGGNIIHAKSLMHGKTSMINHDGKAIFSYIDNPFEAGRYHSLAADQKTIPPTLAITATTEDGEIMGVRHLELPIEGIQFHPESVLTPPGEALKSNFLQTSTTATS